MEHSDTEPSPTAQPASTAGAGVRYGLTLDSWGEASNGHWYGSAWRLTPDGHRDRHTLRYRLTAHQAVQFNALDPTTLAPAEYREGEVSERFYTHTAALEAGLALIREHYGFQSDVEIGRPAHIDNRTVRITAPLTERRIDAACPSCECTGVLVIQEWDETRTTIGCTWCMWGDSGSSDDELLRQVRNGLD